MSEYRAILDASGIVTALAAGDPGLEWTDAVLVSGDPSKGKGAAPRDDLLASRLAGAVGEIARNSDGISPDFAPGRAGVEAFAALASRGVAVRMLKSSLEATEMLPIHAGYARRRRAMLNSGVVLCELRRQAAPDAPTDRFGPFGSSGASLHAKTFAVDGARMFVGSFNFDPRSTTLNTKMGLLINSPAMAEGMRDAFDDGLRGLAWRVELRNGDIVWVNPEPGKLRPTSRDLRRCVASCFG